MNSRPLPWQGNALPLSYARILGWPRLLQIPLARASRKPWRGGRPAGRSGEIRTHDPCLPKTVLYQAELHSETSDAVYIAGPVLPQAGFAAAAAIFPHELVRALCQPGDLPVLRAGTNVRPQLGRSQVVRQRLLVPPCAGSNPAAPATQSVLCRAVPAMCGISPVFRGLPDLRSIWRRRIAVGGAGIGAPVSVCGRCGSVWSWAGVTRLSARAQRAAIMAR